MIWINTKSTDPYYNFGVEYYFTVEKKLDEPVFLFWRTKPTLMIGKYQNSHEEIDLAYARAHDIMIVRRFSGGGTIYTDLGGWQYSFITQGDSGEIDFMRYLEPVLDALHGLGVPAAFNGRNDLTVDGRKFSGTAQYKLSGATVHHGSLLFDTNVEEMVRATTVDAYKLESKSIKSVKSRVANLRDFLPSGMTVEDFRDRMVTAIRQGGSEYVLSDAEKKHIADLGDEHFRSWNAIYGHDPKFETERMKRLPGGTLRVRYNAKKGRIEAIRFNGDFFSAADIRALENALTGIPLRRDAILRVVTESLKNGGIMGMTSEEITETICP